MATAVVVHMDDSFVPATSAHIGDDLPLFSVAVKREAPKPAKSDALGAALGDINPDEMTPREALEALYRLKGLAGK